MSAPRDPPPASDPTREPRPTREPPTTPPSSALHSADVTVPVATADEAQSIAAAMTVELADGPQGTTTAALPEGAAVRIRIEAADLSGLRAAINNGVRLADAAARTLACDTNGT